MTPQLYTYCNPSSSHVRIFRPPSVHIYVDISPCLCKSKPTLTLVFAFVLASNGKAHIRKRVEQASEFQLLTYKSLRSCSNVPAGWSLMGVNRHRKPPPCCQYCKLIRALYAFTHATSPPTHSSSRYHALSKRTRTSPPDLPAEKSLPCTDHCQAR